LRTNLIKAEAYLSLRVVYYIKKNHYPGDSMISLKKNDKIIIIAAVVILVLAGVGVAMYQSPKTTEIVPPNIVVEKNYDVMWTIQNGSLMTISDFAGKKNQFEGSIMIPEGNVISITFNLSWTDDRMTMLKRMGLDTLTLEVTMPDSMYSFSDSATSAQRTGKGFVTHTITNNIIPPETLKADNEKDAQAKLLELPYYDGSWTDKEIKINVSDQIGEIRILKQLRDKGNDFELSITYQYYNGVLKEDTTKNTGTDSGAPPDDLWDDEQTPPYISMIINTGCGRYV
jgi:hypothetical protein